MEDFSKAVDLFGAGAFADAEKICRGLLPEHGNDPNLLSLLGDLCRQDDRIDEAQGWFEQAIQNGSLRPNTFDALGGIYRLKNDWDRAIDCFDQVLRLQPTHRSANDGMCASLASRGIPDDRFMVSIVTPTTGYPGLTRAIEGVQAQTYPNIEHLVVVDGPDAERAVRAMLGDTPRHPVHLLPLPYNTGAGSYNGHRIYGAAMYLVNGRYVCFLDEDNWFDPDHIASMMKAITSRGLQWCYSLRKIAGSDGRVLGRDDCQSLGRWPTWNNPESHLVDTSCYLIRFDIALSLGVIWYRRARPIVGPEFVLCRALMDGYPEYDTSSRYTVNYMEGRNKHSATWPFFELGNAEMKLRYPDGFPWSATGG